MLNYVIKILVNAVLGWVYGKLKRYTQEKAQIKKQRETIERLKEKLKDAETELERKEATIDLANGSF